MDVSLSVIRIALLASTLSANSLYGQVVCDLNGDGVCDVTDIDLLTVEVVGRRGQEPSSPEFDVLADGTMDIGDRDEWLSAAAIANGYREPFLVGDGDLNGSVDAADLMMIGLNWQVVDRTGWGWNGADFTMDGFTNAADLNEVGKNWQRVISRQPEAVPEPMTYLLLMLGFASLYAVSRLPKTADRR